MCGPAGRKSHGQQDIPDCDSATFLTVWWFFGCNTFSLFTSKYFFYLKKRWFFRAVPDLLLLSGITLHTDALTATGSYFFCISIKNISTTFPQSTQKGANSTTYGRFRIGVNISSHVNTLLNTKKKQCMQLYLYFTLVQCITKIYIWNMNVPNLYNYFLCLVCNLNCISTRTTRVEITNILR